MRLLVLVLWGFGLGGCAAGRGDLAELRSSPPDGVVGIVRPDVTLTPKGFDINGLSFSTGLLVDDELLLVTHHQNPFAAGPIDDETLRSPLLVPFFLSMTAGGFGPGHVPLRLVGGGRISASLVATERRDVRFSGPFTGQMDLGWAMLRVHPPQPGPRLRVDFDRPLRVGQTVYVLRPDAFAALQGSGQDAGVSKRAVTTGDLTPYFALLRAGLDEAADVPLRFDAWEGRIASRPEGPMASVDVSGEWLERSGFIHFGFQADLKGASGSPILMRDGDEWIVIGLYSSHIGYDNLFLVRYQYGVFVRPDLSQITAESGEPIDAAKR